MDLYWSFFYMLTGENIRKHVPRSAKMYLLFAKPGHETWMCYYVGQADDLVNRLQEHLSGPDPCMQPKMKASAFRYAEIEARRDRNGVERFLYDRYKPESRWVRHTHGPAAFHILEDLPGKGNQDRAFLHRACIRSGYKVRSK
jgi:hypothetical protein